MVLIKSHFTHNDIIIATLQRIQLNSKLEKLLKST